MNDDWCWDNTKDDAYDTLYDQYSCMPLHIAVAPHDPTDINAVAAVDAFMEWTKVAYPATSTLPGPSNYSTFVNFTSESDFLDLLDTSLYSQDTGGIHAYSSCIVFHAGAPNYEYTLRLNRTIRTTYGRHDMIPTVRKYALDIQVKTGDTVPLNDQYEFEVPFLTEYLNQQYFTLSDVVYSFSMSIACRASGRCDANGLSMSNMVGGVEFPHGKVLTR